MSLNSKQSYVVYIFSVILAIILKIAPWPIAFAEMNPDWILLVLIYWSVNMPERVGIFNAFFIGLLTDVLTGRLLGEYALVYSLVCYFCLNSHKQLRHFPLLQHSVFVIVNLTLSQILIFWMENIQSITQFQGAFWQPILTGVLVFPVIHWLLRRTHNIRKIS